MVISEASPDGMDSADMHVAFAASDAVLDAALRAFNGSTQAHTLWLYSTDADRLWKRFSERFEFVQAAGGVVLDADGRLLVIKRLGQWDLPKGKVERMESIPDAALREVREECGLQELQLVRPLARTWHTYERKGRQHLKRTDWFLMQGNAQEDLSPQTEEDIEEVRWCGRKDARAVMEDTYPSLLPVFEAWLGLPR